MSPSNNFNTPTARPTPNRLHPSQQPLSAAPPQSMPSASTLAMSQMSFAHERVRHRIATQVDEEDVKKFVNTLHNFVRYTTNLVHSKNSKVSSKLSATANLSNLMDLYRVIRANPTRETISRTPLKLLTDVVSLLQARVKESLCSISKADQASGVKFFNPSLALVSAATILSLLCAPNAPRNLLVDDLLEQIVDLLRLVAHSVIFPTFDPMYKHSNTKSTFQTEPPLSPDSNSSNEVPSNEIHQEGGEFSKTLRVQQTNDFAALNPAAKECILDHFNLLLDEFRALFQVERHLPAPVVSVCSSVCVQCMPASGLTRIQFHAFQTISLIFSCYPSHRLGVLDELRDALTVIPSSKKDLRTYRLPDSRHSVRFTSSLACVLLCIATSNERADSSPVVPHISDVNREESFAMSCRAKIGRFNQSVKIAIHLLDPFLVRVFADRDSEFRTAFQSFVDDLLTLYGRPEWPSVETLLQTLSFAAVTKLRAEQENTVIARGFAVDLLGAIASKMCEVYGIQSLRHKDLHHLPQFASSSMAILEGHREDLLIFLRSDKSVVFSAAHSYFENLIFREDLIILRRHVNGESVKSLDAPNGSNVSLDNDEGLFGLDTEASNRLKQITVRRAEKVNLRHERGDVVSRTSAEKAFRAIGVHGSLVSGFEALLETILDGLRDSSPTIRAKAIRALSSINNSCHTFLQISPKVLHHILDSCRDVSILVRDAALDLLSRPLLISDSERNQIVSSESQTQSDASLSWDSEFFGQIFETVLRRLSDTATSVRKRAVSIAHSVLSDAMRRKARQTNAPLRNLAYDHEPDVYEKMVVRICSSIVPRLDDPESSVKAATEKVLRYALFLFDKSSSASEIFDGDPDIALTLAERLTSVFLNLQPKLHTSFLARIVDESLLCKQKSLLLAIVSSSIDQLHSYEASVSTILGERSLPTLSVNEQRIVRDLSARRVSCSSVILAFALLDSSLVESHCRSLAPVLKDVIDGEVTEADLFTVQKILQVLEVGLNQDEIKNPEFLKEVLNDVETIVCQSPTTILEDAAVRCMCTVFRVSDGVSGNVILRIAKVFKEFLDNMVESSNSHKQCSAKEIASLERNGRCAAVRLGLLSRFGTFDRPFVLETFTTLSAMCDAITRFDWSDQLVKASVRALSHFLVRNRSYLGDGAKCFVKLIERVNFEMAHLSSASSVNLAELLSKENRSNGIKLCVLQGFHDLLKDEEDRNSSGNTSSDFTTESHCADHPKSKGRTDSQNTISEPSLAAEEDAEAGFLALAAQLMLPSVMECTYSSSSALRRIVASIVGLLVRQGLLLPATVVPCLLTLLLDQDVVCKHLSMRVISFLAERHSAMLASAIMPAIRTCFKHAFDVYHGSRDRAASGQTSQNRVDSLSSLSLEVLRDIAIDAKTGQSVFSPVFMALRRDQRKSILESMIREFNPGLVIVRRREEVKTRIGETQILTGSSETNKSNSSQNESDGNSADGVEIREVEDIGRKECSLATLFFFGITLACLDFTNGAGIGGSLAHGGGTVNADSKMKTAREDVSELVGVMTRIISNSGQAVLRAVKNVRCRGVTDCVSRERLLRWVVQICLLLQVKHHLKIERWKPLLDSEDNANTCCHVPCISIDTEVVEKVGWRETVEYEDIGDSVFERQLDLFKRLMTDDAIDDRDVSSGRRRRGHGSRSDLRPSMASKVIVKNCGKRMRHSNRRISTHRARKRLRVKKDYGGFDVALKSDSSESNETDSDN